MRRSWRTNTADRSAAPASSAQPSHPAGRSATVDSPSTAAAIATVTTAAPDASSPRSSVRPRPLPDGSPRAATSTASSPIGTLIANAHRHPASSSSTPPSTQPLAPPPAAAAVHQPSARRRAAPSSRVRSCSTARAEGDSSAAAAPWAIRAAISTVDDGAAAQAAEVTAKPRRASRNIGAAPATSAIRPPRSSSPAIATV